MWCFQISYCNHSRVSLLQSLYKTLNQHEVYFGLHTSRNERKIFSLVYGFFYTHTHTHKHKNARFEILLYTFLSPNNKSFTSFRELLEYQKIPNVAFFLFHKPLHSVQNKEIRLRLYKIMDVQKKEDCPHFYLVQLPPW